MANNYHDWTEKQLDEYEGDLVRAVENARKHLNDFRAIRKSKRPIHSTGEKEKEGATA